MDNKPSILYYSEDMLRSILLNRLVSLHGPGVIEGLQIEALEIIKDDAGRRTFALVLDSVAPLRVHRDHQTEDDGAENDEPDTEPTLETRMH